MKSPSLLSALLSLAAFYSALAAGESLESPIRAALHIAQSQQTPHNVSATVDLNGDGLNDTLVLITDARYCGSGGCLLLVFEGTAGGPKLISKSTITKPPVRVAQQRVLGWRSLLVDSGGTGTVMLDFDGNRYPSNPSMQRHATAADISAAETVIPGYGN